jgi:uncharacterized protein (DUF1778 family)
MTKAAPKTSRGRTRSERLEARVSAEQKSLIERAAALQGRTVTDFVLTSVQDAARRAIEEHQQLELSVRDSEAFVGEASGRESRRAPRSQFVHERC